jgi:hypothetical protein
VQGLGDRAWVGWDVGLVEYQYEGGRKGIAKCLVHLRMKQIYLFVPFEPTQRNAFIELYLDSQEELYFKILEHMGFKNEERRFLEYPKYYPPQRSKWDD